VTDLPPTPAPTWRFRLIARLVILCVWLGRWRIRTGGLEHVPQRGGAVITWNHHSHLDFVVTMYDVYRRLGRPCRYLALRELWRSRTLWWVPRLADAVPVDRASEVGRAASLRHAVAALEQGHLVVVAPEAGISTSFELLRFRTGAARMAQAAGVPLIPSASWGSQRLSTTGHRFAPLRTIGLPVEVRFGAPLHVAPGDDVVAVTERLRERTAELLARIQADYPGGAPAGAWWVPARLGGGAPLPEHDPPGPATSPSPWPPDTQ
jgi:1-acyl-sn-glycerol-3-phosphate acyltransferase